MQEDFCQALGISPLLKYQADGGPSIADIMAVLAGSETPADDLQGPLSADWAKRRGVKTVCILDDNEVYGKGIADLFDERCREIGIEVLGHDSIDAKAQEFKSLMASIKAAKPDLVYFGATTQSKGGQLAKDMASAGINAILYYLNDIFLKAGFSKVSSDLQAVAIGCTNLLFTMAAITVIDRFGRRALLLTGSVGTAACLSCGVGLVSASSTAAVCVVAPGYYSTGVSVNATTPDSTMLMAIVNENSR